MTIFSRYLIRNVFIGFAAAAGLLIPLFTTFTLINELEDVTPGGYRWQQALLVTVLTLPAWSIWGRLSRCSAASSGWGSYLNPWS